MKRLRSGADENQTPPNNFPLNGALNTRVINFSESNNHLTGLLVDYLSHSLGLPGDPEGTNTVIGLLKAALGDFIVLAGLRDWLNTQWSAGLIENPYQKDFNQWCLDHINTQAGEINAIDSTLNTIDTWMNRIDKVVSIISKAIRIIMRIINIFGFVEIPQGATPQYTYNPNFDPDDPDELEEFINALDEIITNGWFKSKSYTKTEVDTLLTRYLRDDTAITLTNPLTLQNTSLTLGNKTVTGISDAGGFGHTDLTTVGFVADAISGAFSTTMASYYTKTETDNLFILKDSLLLGSVTINFKYLISTTGTFNTTAVITDGQIQFVPANSLCYLTSTFLCPVDNTPDISDIYITSIAFSGSSYKPLSGFVWPGTAVNPATAKALCCSLQEIAGRGYHIKYKDDSAGTMWSLAPGRVLSVVQLPFDLIV